MFIATKYIGNASEEKFQIVIAKKPVNTENNPPIKALLDSVSGNFQTLTIVGMDARPSLTIAKTIAKLGSFVIYQITKANTDDIPQNISN